MTPAVPVAVLDLHVSAAERAVAPCCCRGYVRMIARDGDPRQLTKPSILVWGHRLHGNAGLIAAAECLLGVIIRRSRTAMPRPLSPRLRTSRLARVRAPRSTVGRGKMGRYRVAPGAIGALAQGTSAYIPDNAFVERLIGSIPRERLDHVVVFGESHLRRILKAYVAQYNEVSTHLSLAKGASMHRPIQRLGRIALNPILGGLHYEYCRI